MNSIELVFSGDLAPVGRVEEACLQNKHDSVISGIVDTLRQADLHITNLECPLTLANETIDKSGPPIKAHPLTMNLLKSLRVGLVCLANNHIRDYCHQGVMDTIDLCQANGIATVGAGKNLDAARKITYLEVNRKTLAFINYCEAEFSIASLDDAGANPIDPVNAFYDIAAALKITPLVFVIFHGGHEAYSLPSPRIKKLFHYLADLGAAAVIGHHPHVVSGYEYYKEKPLIYSLGNFIFDEPEYNSPEWYYGVLASLTIKPDNCIELKMKYLKQEREILSIRFLEAEKLTSFEKEINLRSEIITNDTALTQAWYDFADHHCKGFIKQIMRLNKVKRGLYKLGLPLSWVLKKKRILPQLNIIQCESHRDTLLYSLKSKI